MEATLLVLTCGWKRLEKYTGFFILAYFSVSPVPWLLPEGGEVAIASDNQVEPIREIKVPPSEKLYLEFGEATPRTEGWRGWVKVGMCFAFQFVEQKSRQMLVPPPYPCGWQIGMGRVLMLTYQVPQRETSIPDRCVIAGIRSFPGFGLPVAVYHGPAKYL